MLQRSTLFAAAFALSLPIALSAAESGWTTGVDLSVEASAGLTGGAQRGEALHALGLAHAGWAQPDAKEGATHFTGYLSALALAGAGPTERYLGDFLAASNSEGHQSARLYAWWLQAERAGWSLRGGVLLADEEFTGTAMGACFFNSAFGWPAFISANTVNTGPAFYVAAPGLRLQRTWNETTAWRIGIYDGDTFDSPAGDPGPTGHGLHYQVGGAQGWFLITEADFAPSGGATRLTVGAWLHTADFADVRDDAFGQPFAVSGRAPRQHASNHGLYSAIEHTVAGEPGKAGSIEVFLRGGFSPADRNALGWALDGGIGWTGPIPGRPADVAALGIAHARFSPRYSAGARLAAPASPAPDFEQAIEASYTVKLGDHFNVQPDLQFIRHPGGSTAQGDAVAFFLRFNSSY
jgi:porin